MLAHLTAIRTLPTEHRVIIVLLPVSEFPQGSVFVGSQCLRTFFGIGTVRSKQNTMTMVGKVQCDTESVRSIILEVGTPDMRATPDAIAFQRRRPSGYCRHSPHSKEFSGQGKISEGTRLFGDAKKSALRNSPESAADVQLDLANLEADFGLRAAAHKDALGALGLNKNATELAFSARALARVGDIADAQMEAKSAASLAPLDTILNFGSGR